MEVRDPIDVHKTGILSETRYRHDLHSDELLQRTLVGISLIKLLYNQLNELNTATSISDLRNHLSQVKILARSEAFSIHSKLLNSDWHKTLFRCDEIKDKDAITWYHLNKKDCVLSCIYDGNIWLSLDLIMPYIEKEDLFCIIFNDGKGQKMAFFKINPGVFLVTTLPIIDIRIFEDFEHATNTLLQGLLSIGESYHITTFYINTKK